MTITNSGPPAPSIIRYIVTVPGVDEAESSASYHVSMGPGLARASAFFTAGQISGKITAVYTDGRREEIGDFSTGEFVRPAQSSPPNV